METKQIRDRSKAAERRARAISDCAGALRVAADALSNWDSLFRAIDCLLALGVARRIISRDDRADLAFIVSEYAEQLGKDTGFTDFCSDCNCCEEA